MTNWVKKAFQGTDGSALEEVRRIRKALEIIALHFAKVDNRMWHPEPVALAPGQSEEEAEVLHTDDLQLKQAYEKEMEHFQAAGWTER